MGTSFGAMMAQLMQPGQIERVDSLLWRMGLLEERRHARPFLRVNEVAGIVMANSKSSPIGTPVRLQSASSKVDPVSVTINGVPLDNPGPLHMVMHKRPGTVCTHADDEGETVYDSLPEDALVRYPLLASVGRLDRLASGLLLFSQSGDLIHRLTSPESHVPRTYIVRLQNPLAGDGREALLLAMGTLRLIDGHTCKPAVLEPHPTDATAARITVFEGHHRLVRRAFSALGNRVLALHRSHFGPMDLAAMGLAPGESRRLSAAELYSLLQASARPTRRHLRAIERTRLRASRIAAVPEVPASLLEAVDRAAGLIGPGAAKPETAPAALTPSDQHRTRGRTRPDRGGASSPAGGGRGQDSAAGPEGSDSDWVDLDELGSRMGLRSSAAELQSIAEQSPTFHEALVTAGPRDGVAVDAFVEARKAVAARSGWTQAGHAAPTRSAQQTGSDDDSRHSVQDEPWEDLAANADGWGSDAWDDAGDLDPLADVPDQADTRRGGDPQPGRASTAGRQVGRSAAEVLRMRPSLGAGRPLQEVVASSAEEAPERSRGRRKSVVRQAIEVGSAAGTPRRAAQRTAEDSTAAAAGGEDMIAVPPTRTRGPSRRRSPQAEPSRSALSVREAGRVARAARAAKQEGDNSRR